MEAAGFHPKSFPRSFYNEYPICVKQKKTSQKSLSILDELDIEYDRSKCLSYFIQAPSIKVKRQQRAQTHQMR